MTDHQPPHPARGRCPGSLQAVLAGGPATPCPTCGKPVDAVPIHGRLYLVEHRRRSDEALPMALFA